MDQFGPVQDYTVQDPTSRNLTLKPTCEVSETHDREVDIAQSVLVGLAVVDRLQGSDVLLEEQDDFTLAFTSQARSGTSLGSGSQAKTFSSDHMYRPILTVTDLEFSTKQQTYVNGLEASESRFTPAW